MTVAKADRIIPLVARARVRAPGPQHQPQRRPRPLLRSVLGEVLRGIRHAQHRTLADVARASKISVPYLSEVERGRKEASSEVLAALSDALGVPLSRVLSEAGEVLADELTESARRGRTEALRELRSVPARDLARGPAVTPSTIRELTPSRVQETGPRGDVLLLAA